MLRFEDWAYKVIGDLVALASQTDRGSTTPGPDSAGFLDDARFSQTFTLPSGPGRPHPFRVTYSDYGHRDPEGPSRERVLLFCGPLMGR
ncbi:hypothetical protein CH063_10862 [Colletotrichum higginsianum]|uniref:Uncharacterized protein n=1 Tax=Colletotrichum higginsianum (strain IMI 349063) TaxID=759273 RepID=H1VJ37_COLHI|nr:hypothetical protein CH063_10862 [Colletotrichum higginsianum]